MNTRAAWRTTRNSTVLFLSTFVTSLMASGATGQDVSLANSLLHAGLMALASVTSYWKHKYGLERLDGDTGVPP